MPSTQRAASKRLPQAPPVRVDRSSAPTTPPNTIRRTGTRADLAGRLPSRRIPCPSDRRAAADQAKQELPRPVRGDSSPAVAEWGGPNGQCSRPTRGSFSTRTTRRRISSRAGEQVDVFDHGVCAELGIAAFCDRYNSALEIPRRRATPHRVKQLVPTRSTYLWACRPRWPRPVW